MRKSREQHSIVGRFRGADVKSGFRECGREAVGLGFRQPFPTPLSCYPTLFLMFFNNNVNTAGPPTQNVLPSPSF